MPDRRQLNRDRTSAAIVTAALELFAEAGFDAATVEQIADRAEVSPVTVFRYFGSKDAILFATLADEAARLREVVLGVEPFPDPRRVVVAALLQFAREMPVDKQQYALRSRIIAESPALQRAALATRVEFESTLFEALVTRSADGDPLVPRVAAAAGVTAFHMAVRTWRDGHRGTLEQVALASLTALWPDLF